MKRIFLTLVLVNLGYLVYQLGMEPKAGSQEKSALKRNDEYPAIQLLSERKGRSERQLEVEQVLENPISVDSGIYGGDDAERGCQGLGPFGDVIAAQDAAERFSAIGFVVALRAVDETTGEFDYRVVLPPAPSLQEAFRRLRELKSRDIDSYVISQGDDALGISLGVFSNNDSAVQHQQSLAEEGYTANIREIPRVIRGYWVFGLVGGVFPTAQLAPLTAENPTIEVRETACLN